MVSEIPNEFGEYETFFAPYDVLVYAVGATVRALGCEVKTCKCMDRSANATCVHSLHPTPPDPDSTNPQTTTFGTPGVKEHCMFLKEVPDAVALRKAIVDRFERASMPSVPLEEKKRILSFVVVGGGVCKRL